MIISLDEWREKKSDILRKLEKLGYQPSGMKAHTLAYLEDLYKREHFSTTLQLALLMECPNVIGLMNGGVE